MAQHSHFVVLTLPSSNFEAYKPDYAMGKKKEKKDVTCTIIKLLGKKNISLADDYNTIVRPG